MTGRFLKSGLLFRLNFRTGILCFFRMVATFNLTHTIADVRTYITTYPFQMPRACWEAGDLNTDNNHKQMCSETQ